MADYTIRVVLHDNATWENYENLKTRLAAKGVVDYILSSDNEWWRLPPGEYAYTGNETSEVVRGEIFKIAGAIKSCAVFVTNSNGRVWMGLEKLSGPG